MSSLSDRPPGVVRVGPAGWSYADWKGIVYPPRMPRSLHPVEYLSGYFDTVEIDSAFYHPPIAKNAALWVKKVAANPRFRFTVKLWQRFTHERDTWPGEAAVRTYTEGIAPLAEAGLLGAVLIQFPWSFKRTPESRQWLSRVLGAFAAYPRVVEVRHASWNCPELYDGLAELGVGVCNIDQPLFRDSIQPDDRATTHIGYVRLHGRNAADWFREDAGRDDRYNYLYPANELDAWRQRIERVRAVADDTYVITNNHFEGQAIVNAFELQDGLGIAAAPPPPCLVAAYSRLQRLAPTDLC